MNIRDTLTASKRCFVALAVMPLAFCPSSATAYANETQQSRSSEKAATAPTGFENRHLVLLKRTTKPASKDTAMQKLQQQHLANLRAMAKAGFLLVAGPTRATSPQPSDLSGLLIFKLNNTADRNQIDEMIQADPMIKAGYLKAEAYQFIFESGDNLYTREPRRQNHGTN